MKETAKIFKALSDETRLRILVLLREYGELCVCDLMTALELPQSTVSRHVAYMKNAGLLNDKRCGVWMHYSIRQESGQFQKALIGSTFNILYDDETAAGDRARLIAYRATKDTTTCP